LGHKWEKVVTSSKKWEIVKKLFTKSLSRSLDPKGRLMLPPEYRDGLIADGGSGTFWLTAFYGRLVAYLPADWDLVTEQLSSIPMPSPRLSHFKTKVMGLAQELEPDAQGRVRIPQVLMHEAKLHKDVMLVGMLNKFEIWDQASFNGLQLEDVSEELTGLGINLSL
jgi:MraZ protein